MYVICVYDVQEKRCAKVMKVLRKYLFHVQKSVFEGEATPSRLIELQDKLNQILKDEDSVIFYTVNENKKLHKSYLGKKTNELNIII